MDRNWQLINQKVNKMNAGVPSNGHEHAWLNLSRVFYHRHLGGPIQRSARVAGLITGFMPPRRGSVSTNGSGKCTKCGKNTGAVSIKEHIKLYHQEKCIVSFPGRTISVKRDSDGFWRCPVCAEDCGRHPRRLQDHARANACMLDGVEENACLRTSLDSSSSDASELVRTDHEPLRSSSETSSYLDAGSEVLLTHPGFTSAAVPEDFQYTYDPVDIGIDEFLCSTPSSDTGSVNEFLSSLRRPAGHLLGAFQQMGIETAKDLDTLCRMNNQHLEQVKRYLVDHGMSQFLWLVIREGLKSRAERLLAQSR